MLIIPAMKRGMAIGLVVGWLLGMVTWMGYAYLTGGSYEYRVAWNEEVTSMVNTGDWELVSMQAPPNGGLVGALRRPKIRIGR